MKFSALTIISLFLSNSEVVSFTPSTILKSTTNSNVVRRMAMEEAPAPAAAADMPAVAIEQVAPSTAQDLPVIQARGGIAEVRYSDFLKLVNNDRVEKVTFSADGTQLLGVDTEGTRIKIEALPNDPELLNSLTTHKVRKIQ